MQKSPFAQLGAKPKAVRLGGSATPRAAGKRTPAKPLKGGAPSALTTSKSPKGEQQIYGGTSDVAAVDGGALSNELTPRMAAQRLGQSPYLRPLKAAGHACLAFVHPPLQPEDAWTRSLKTMAVSSSAASSQAYVVEATSSSQDEEDPSAVFDRLLGERQREEAGTLPRQAVKEFILSRGDSDEKLAAWAGNAIDLNGDGEIDRAEWLDGWAKGLIV